MTDLPKGLSKPARRALANAGVLTLEALATRSEAEIARLHGMGPNGVATLRAALAASGLTFAR